MPHGVNVVNKIFDNIINYIGDTLIKCVTIFHGTLFRLSLYSCEFVIKIIV